jgi:hypothetical protein
MAMFCARITFWKKGAGFHGGVVGDDHKQTSADASESGDRAGRRSAAPLFVHFMRGVDAQLKEMRAGVDKLLDPLASREPALFVLGFDGFWAAALGDLLFFVLDLRKEIDDLAAVFREVRRLGVDAGFQDGRGHSQASR